MGQIVQRQKRVEALKLLNNAIVTSRLYPPDAPQVGTAVERGYKGLKVLLRDQGPLRFSLKNDWPWLGDEPLDQETLDAFPNLVVYRQLRQLGLPQMLLGAEMDRFAFGQILLVFNTPQEKAKKAGGGLAYITGLGLSGFFPEDGGEAGQKSGSEEGEARKRKLVKAKPELLACLFGRDQRPAVEAELRKQLAATESGVDLLAAAIGHVLQDILKKGVNAASPHFPTLIEGVAARLGDNDSRAIVTSLARVLVDYLREPALSVLLSQHYPSGLGERLYEALVSALSTESLGRIYVLFREQIARERLAGGDASPRMAHLGAAFKRLMSTTKGKQYLSSERAKAIIHEGEASRRAQRIETGIRLLLQGRLEVLRSEELLQALPEAIAARLAAASPAPQEAETLLARFIDYLPGNEAGESPYLVLVRLGEMLLAADRRQAIDTFLPLLADLLKRAILSEESVHKVVTFLHQLMQASWERGENARGDAILALFHGVRSGKIGRSPLLQAVVGTVQDKGIQRPKLPELLAEYLASPLDEEVGRRLAQQGPVALRFLVESLINTEDMDDRMRIIDLLIDHVAFLTPIILERLGEHMPWYGKRNLLKLLGEAGRDEDAEHALPYLRHEDFRVQREAFVCLYKIGGKRRKKLFLDALSDSSELIKLQIIEALGGLCDQEVATRLCELLLDNQQFSEKFRGEIVLQLLETLGRSGTSAAYNGVETFIENQGQRGFKKLPEQVWGAAARALENLDSDLQEQRRKHLHAGQLRKSAMKQAARLQNLGKEQRVITGLAQEQTVRALLAQGDREGARQQLLRLVEKTARTRNFVQAESLREWLIEIDPTAFKEIIEVAEIIDREKLAAIDQGHLEIWAKLYERLTSDEFAALYHSQKHKQYRDGEVIVGQGAMQTSLFFINRGRVKLYFDERGHEVLVKTLGPGEIFGAGSFFNASVWTLSVAAVGTADISTLKLDRLGEWNEQFPGLEGKLREFCADFERVEDLVRDGGWDRRAQERLPISGRVSTTMLDERGQSLGINAMVELCDISLGGMCFQQRISRKENIRLLLGRKVQVRMPVGEKPGEFVSLSGDVLAVRGVHLVESDYSVHVRFDQPLEGARLREIHKAVGAQGWAA